ncbi:hypothetical protein QUF64_12300 [Anaerolineales bacterium HSG6]|nr:hypothetical protein [Anaerolineales bacterium HSG6]
MGTVEQSEKPIRNLHDLESLNTEKQFHEASVKTVGNLKSIVHSMALSDVSQLSLPEIDAVVEQVAEVVPAGNVPGVLLNGLARLPGRRPPEKTVKRDIGLLFKGVRQALDKAVYSATFAGPAAVIWGYQNLLKLSGKDPEESFPEGTWQFYLDYALREDTARHLLETHGFDSTLNQHKIDLNQADRVTAWVLAAIHCLHQYQGMLKNEWRERVYTSLLKELTQDQPQAEQVAKLYQTWEQQRPYSRGQDAHQDDTYPTYRQHKFDQFFEATLKTLPPEIQAQFKEQIADAEATHLPAYQQQMSILTSLNAETDSESRVPVSLKQAHIGLIYQGRYYLIPACAPRTEQPADINAVRAQVTAMLSYPVNTHPPQLIDIATLKRSEWATIRKKLDRDMVKELDMLRTAPILINVDQRPPDLPLTELRQVERGVGDHPMTLFDTEESILFDQAHIFFDGPWAASLSQIMTTEALSWAVYLSQVPAGKQRQSRPHAPALKLKPAERQMIQNAPHVLAETSAQTKAVKLRFMQRLRQLFKRRNDLLELTVNDMLILYRAIHSATYQPTAEITTQLKALLADPQTKAPAQATLEAINQTQETNPAIVIPIDASLRAPRDRLHPMTFEVPLQELDLLNLHQRVITALDDYKTGSGDRTTLYGEFDKYQRSYLASLAGFGMVLSKSHEIANSGEATTGKLLATMPLPLQKMFDNMPSRFDVLNDVIRGREIFANIGLAPRRSSIKRFMSAKDDSDKKLLTWGVVTGTDKVMRLTLRDARPHVAMLQTVGQGELATAITQDYLDSYAKGLNEYLKDLWRITESSRETRMATQMETQMIKELERRKQEGLL